MEVHRVWKLYSNSKLIDPDRSCSVTFQHGQVAETWLQFLSIFLFLRSGDHAMASLPWKMAVKDNHIKKSPGDLSHMYILQTGHFLRITLMFLLVVFSTMALCEQGATRPRKIQSPVEKLVLPQG